MYQGFELAQNETVKNTYIGTIDADVFADAYVEKQLEDIGLICYKQITISDGAPFYVVVYYEPQYSEGVFTGYDGHPEDDGGEAAGRVRARPVLGRARAGRRREGARGGADGHDDRRSHAYRRTRRRVDRV